VKRADFAADESALATLKLKANFRTLGPRLGSDVKKAAAALARLDAALIEQLASGQNVSLDLPGIGDGKLQLSPDDVVIEHVPVPGMVVATESGIVVALETALTDALVLEGLAREVVNKVQNMRKTADLQVTRRIRLEIGPDKAVKQAIENHMDYIKTETLCLDLRFHGSAPGQATEQGIADETGAVAWDVNGHPCSIRLIPV
jgi:isoleucyl-tRNA synthetase